MAFFGLTRLGYQDPLRDNMRDDGIGVNSGPPPSGQEQGGTPGSSDAGGPRPLPRGAQIHGGSQELYREMVKRAQTPRSPDQVYRQPVTDSQRYGWLASKPPQPWTRVQRFPRKNSEMTKFVKEMSLSDPEFSLF